MLLLTCLLTTSSTLVLGFDNSTTPLLDLYVLEELPADSIVGRVELNRKLTSEQRAGLRYSLLSRPTAPDGSVSARPLFRIDERSGTIRTAQRLDRDALCRQTDESCYIRFDLAVRPMSRFRIVRVRVDVVDVNDNAPSFPRRSLVLAVPESAAVGTSLPIPAAHDADAGVNGQVRYVIVTTPSSPPSAFQLAERSRSDIRLVLTSPLDRETVDRYQLTIVAEDGGNPPQSGSIQVRRISPTPTLLCQSPLVDRSRGVRVRREKQ